MKVYEGQLCMGVGGRNRQGTVFDSSANLTFKQFDAHLRMASSSSCKTGTSHLKVHAKGTEQGREAGCQRLEWRGVHHTYHHKSQKQQPSLTE